MIIEVRAKNCYAFRDEIAFSMKADMRSKKFSSNVHKENKFNILKKFNNIIKTNRKFINVLTIKWKDKVILKLLNNVQ